MSEHGIVTLAAVEMFGKHRICQVTSYGDDVMMAYPKDRTLWVERAEDEYGVQAWLESTPKPCCVLRREDWIKGDCL